LIYEPGEKISLRWTVSGEYAQIALDPGSLDLSGETHDGKGEHGELDPSLFKPDQDGRYTLTVKSKNGPDPKPQTVEVRPRTDSWITFIPKYESEVRFPAEAQKYDFKYADLEFQGFIKLEGTLKFDEGILETEVGYSKAGGGKDLKRELAVEIGKKLCDGTLPTVFGPANYDLTAKAKFFVPFKSLRPLQLGETEEEKTTYFKVAGALELIVKPEAFDLGEQEIGPFKVKGNLQGKYEAEFELINVSKQTTEDSIKKLRLVPAEILATEFKGGLMFVGKIEGPNPFAEDGKKIEFEGAISGGPVFKVIPNWRAILQEAIKPALEAMLAELTLDTVIVAGEATAIVTVPLLGIGAAFYYGLIEPAAAWRDVTNLKRDFEAFRIEFNKGFVEALVKAGSLEIDDDDQSALAAGRRMGNRYWRALFNRMRKQQPQASDQTNTNALLWQITKQGLLEKAVDTVQEQLDSQMRHDFYMAFLHAHPHDNEYPYRDCAFIYLYGDLVDHHDYNIAMPPGVPDDVLQQALKDAWYNHVPGGRRDDTPRPKNRVAAPADLKQPLPQNGGEDEGAGGPPAASGWNPALPKQAVDLIPRHLPPDPALGTTDLQVVDFAEGREVWPWPANEEYEIKDPAQVPGEPKLASIHLNRWYERRSARYPWVGWVEASGKKRWIHLEFRPESTSK
jgi:hypothetical protein